MGNTRCPICGGTADVYATYQRSVHVKCQHCGEFNISEDLNSILLQDQSFKERNAINAFLQKNEKSFFGSNGTLLFYTFYRPIVPGTEVNQTGWVNVDKLLLAYPETIDQRADSVLLNFHYEKKNLSSDLSTWACLPCDYFCETTSSNDDDYFEAEDFLRILGELGYLTITKESKKLSINGIRRIENLLVSASAIPQGFIAMKFGTENEETFKALKEGISKAGYLPRRIDGKQFNDDITSEILYEINKSAFLVIDLTIQNYGAYYEAGYARGHGKEVIFTCKSENGKLPSDIHFDVSHNNILLWTTPEDLVEKLRNRIVATVGKGTFSK